MNVSVKQQSDGSYRWHGVTTNNLRDRDGEIIPLASQIADVARMKAEKQFGDADWFHTKLPVKGGVTPFLIASCDYAEMVGGFRVESGVFYDNIVGKAVSELDEPLKMSLEFLYNASEKANGVYGSIKTIRRAFLPNSTEANRFTSVGIINKEANTMDISKAVDKLSDMIQNLGVDATKQALETVDQLDTAALAQSVERKEASKTEEADTATANALATMQSQVDAMSAQLKELITSKPEAKAKEVGNDAILAQLVKNQSTLISKVGELASQVKEMEQDVPVSNLEKLMDSLTAKDVTKSAPRSTDESQWMIDNGLFSGGLFSNG